MKLTITSEEVSEAKRITKEFDAQKTYNKFVCNTNYIGLLGETILTKYLISQHIKHEHIEFVKKGWNQPDFIINGKSIDLKTTYSDSMWFQEPKYDIYIYSRMSNDDSSLEVIGYVTKEDMIKYKQDGTANAVTRNGRTDYVIKQKDMRLIGEEFPPFLN
jgi:hypothetical protein